MDLVRAIGAASSEPVCEPGAAAGSRAGKLGSCRCSSRSGGLELAAGAGYALGRGGDSPQQQTPPAPRGEGHWERLRVDPTLLLQRGTERCHPADAAGGQPGSPVPTPHQEHHRPGRSRGPEGSRRQAGTGPVLSLPSRLSPAQMPGRQARLSSPRGAGRAAQTPLCYAFDSDAAAKGPRAWPRAAAGSPTLCPGAPGSPR